MTEPATLFLVRHGQTDLNRDKRFRGMTDAPLNEAGRAEVAAAARVLDGTRLKAIHTSPLSRAVQTARIIADVTGCSVEPDRSFLDIDYGEWQGLTVDEVERRFGAAQMDRWVKDPGSFEFPGGDSMSGVIARVDPALRALVQTNGPGPVAVVSHLAVLKVCFLALMDLGFEQFWKIVIDNGSVSRFDYTPEDGFVLGWWNHVEQ